MTKRIFKSICIVAISVFLASLIFIIGILYNYFSDTQVSQLKSQALFVAQGVEKIGTDYIDGLDVSNYRITWINADGSVKYDSEKNASEMENHLEREEIKEAFQNGYGEALRYSTTLMEKQLYSAVRLNDGTVLRLSVSEYTWWTLIIAMLQPIAAVIILAVVLSLVLAFRLSKRIVQPLNEMSLDSPDNNGIYEELTPLVERIRSQQRQLISQKSELQRKRDEFEAATNNMSEGLVLLNKQGIILSVNRTASRLLRISSFCIGKDILLLNNSYTMQELLRKAQNGEHAEMTITVGKYDYQINASPVISDNVTTGIVLLIFDITEKEKAEQMRREFTANVSHELKTPLQTILGSAELLTNNLVRAEDIPKFSEKIFTESKRMITLVEDIIKLSHLDEGSIDMKREDTDLYAVAAQSVKSLANVAERSKITLTLSGEPSIIHGIPQLLSIIVYNLCDNAIKYNKENGYVKIRVENHPDNVKLCVSDSGIGIPQEQQERIFERFYRVDKSHSKEVGGTGLGLSIVKHAAKLHDAKISLQSELGKGTTITITFPKQN